MRLLSSRLLAVVLLAACGFVHAAPPSQAQIDRLMEVTQVRETIAAMLPQVLVSQEQMIQQELAGHPLSKQQQRHLDAATAAATRAVADLLSWEQLQPLYRDLYTQIFTAEEVQAMIDFYTSPVGQSMVQKTPLLLQNAMQSVEARLRPILEELQHALDAAKGGHAHPH